MKKLLHFCGLVLALITANFPAQAQFLRQVVNSKYVPVKNSVVWGKKGSKDVEMPLHFPIGIRPSSLLVGRDHPNGTKFWAMFPGVAVSLPLDFGKEFVGLDDYGNLSEGYFVQVAEYDFDKDKVPEIIVCIGDGYSDLAVNIVKYHAPQTKKDAQRMENWSLLGSFTGQRKVDLEANTITLPFGSQGLFEEFTLVKGKFVQTN